MTNRPARRFRGNPRARRGLMTAAGAFATVGVAALIGVVIALFIYFGQGPAARSGGSTTVVLRAGAGLQEIAAELRRAGVIGSDAVFVAASEVTGAAHKLKAGEYAFASRSSLAQIISAIADGRVVRHFITVPEGVTSEQVMEILMQADFLTGVVAAPAEGSVLPETYEARRGDDRSGSCCDA